MLGRILNFTLQILFCCRRQVRIARKSKKMWLSSYKAPTKRRRLVIVEHEKQSYLAVWTVDFREIKVFFFALSWIFSNGFELIFLSPISFQTKIYVCTNARLSIIGLGLYFLESKGCHASHIVPYLLWIEDKLLDIEFTERQTGRFSKNISNFPLQKWKNMIPHPIYSLILWQAVSIDYICLVFFIHLLL